MFPNTENCQLNPFTIQLTRVYDWNTVKRWLALYRFYILRLLLTLNMFWVSLWVIFSYKIDQEKYMTLS